MGEQMKMLNQKQMVVVLTWLGAAPFLILALLVATRQTLPQLPASPALILHVYAVGIANFVAGLHWGIHFCKRTNDNVYLYSSAIALLLILGLLDAGGTTGLVLVLLAFLLLWIVEYRLSRQRVTTAWFWQLRSAATVVVSVCLLAALVSV